MGLKKPEKLFLIRKRQKGNGPTRQNEWKKNTEPTVLSLKVLPCTELQVSVVLTAIDES